MGIFGTDDNVPVRVTGAHKVNEPQQFRPTVDCYADYIRAKIKADLEAPFVKDARDQWIAQLARPFGLAVADPDNLDQHAIEAGIEPTTFKSALRTPEGQRIGKAMYGRLRDSGRLEQNQAGQVKQSLIDLIERSVTEGTMSMGLAPKALEIISKLPVAEAAPTATVLPPNQFKGSPTELIAEIMAWGDEQSAARMPALMDRRGY